MSGTPPLVPDPDSPGAERRKKERRRKEIKKDWDSREKEGKQKREEENDREERKIKGLRGKKNNCVTSLMSEYYALNVHFHC